MIQTGAWVLPDARALPPELERFLDAGAPPIYFGFGSMRAAPEVGRSMLESARALGRRAIVSRGWGDLAIPPDAGDGMVIGDVNDQALFPRVEVVVHHGGAGTTTTAAASGRPQIVVPQLYDQHYWAQRVEALGIGYALPPGAPTSDALVGAIEQASRPDCAARARSIATSIRFDGAELAARRMMEGR